MGSEKEGPLRNPKGERDKHGPAKTRAVPKVHKQREMKDRSTRMSSECG